MSWSSVWTGLLDSKRRSRRSTRRQRFSGASSICCEIEVLRRFQVCIQCAQWRCSPCWNGYNPGKMGEEIYLYAPQLGRCELFFPVFQQYPPHHVHDKYYGGVQLPVLESHKDEKCVSKWYSPGKCSIWPMRTWSKNGYRGTRAGNRWWTSCSSCMEKVLQNTCKKEHRSSSPKLYCCSGKLYSIGILHLVKRWPKRKSNKRTLTKNDRIFYISYSYQRRLFPNRHKIFYALTYRIVQKSLQDDLKLIDIIEFDELIIMEEMQCIIFIFSEYRQSQIEKDVPPIGYILPIFLA